MRIEPLGELLLTYGERGFVLVRPFGSEEGSGYGTGTGTIAGDRVNGSVSWVNAPHRRSDVVMLPHCHGLIDTTDGATIVFAMEGRTPLTGTDANAQLLRLSFETDDPRYAWMNTAFVIAEGVIRELEPGSERYGVVARLYTCVHELQAA